MNLRFLLAILLMLHAQAGWAAAGSFLSVVGDVRVVAADGRQRAAVRGNDVESGETVVTADGAFAQLNMSDGARLAVREDSELKLDDYTYDDDRGAGRSFMSLLRGTMRSITGLIGRRDKSSYSVRTPHATIGIRGTDHQVTVLLRPRDGYQPGTFDVVFTGMTVMQTGAGAIQIAPRQAGYVSGQSARPQVIEVPAFLQRAAARSEPTAPTRARTREAGAKDTGDDAKPTGDDGTRRSFSGTLQNRLGTTATDSKTAVSPLRTPLTTPLTSPLNSGTTTTTRLPESGTTSTILRTPLTTQTPTTTLQKEATTLTPLPSRITAPTLTSPTLTPTQKTPTTSTMQRTPTTSTQKGSTSGSTIQRR